MASLQVQDPSGCLPGLHAKGASGCQRLTSWAQDHGQLHAEALGDQEVPGVPRAPVCVRGRE